MLAAPYQHRIEAHANEHIPGAHRSVVVPFRAITFGIAFKRLTDIGLRKFGIAPVGVNCFNCRFVVFRGSARGGRKRRG